MKTVKAGALYFVIVFAAGFALGSIRVPFLVPRFGTRIAELMEMPIMFVVVVLAARWIVRRFALPPAGLSRLAVGFIALGLLLVAEFTLVHWLRRLTIGEYLADRDPVAGAVYAAMLLVFALMPLLVTRR